MTATQMRWLWMAWNFCCGANRTPECSAPAMVKISAIRQCPQFRTTPTLIRQAWMIWRKTSRPDLELFPCATINALRKRMQDTGKRSTASRMTVDRLKTHTWTPMGNLTPPMNLAARKSTNTSPALPRCSLPMKPRVSTALPQQCFSAEKIRRAAFASRRAGLRDTSCRTDAATRWTQPTSLTLAASPLIPARGLTCSPVSPTQPPLCL